MSHLGNLIIQHNPRIPFGVMLLIQRVQYPISGKILGLTLWAKMLSANQIIGFFKIQYLKKEVNDE